jgi:hypothetical protein
MKPTRVTALLIRITAKIMSKHGTALTMLLMVKSLLEEYGIVLPDLDPNPPDIATDQCIRDVRIVANLVFINMALVQAILDGVVPIDRAARFNQELVDQFQLS